MSVADTNLINCPNCGHSAYNHWRLKDGVWDDATKGQKPEILGKHIKIKDGKWMLSMFRYAPNSHPGNLPTEGCFKAIGEYFKANLHDPIKKPYESLGWNYHKFCECPIDQETVLALIRQGKTFTGTLEDDLENPPTDSWPKQAIDFCQSTPVPDIPAPVKKELSTQDEDEDDKDIEVDGVPEKPKPSFWQKIGDFLNGKS